jgi:hypothetical protein
MGDEQTPPDRSAAEPEWRRRKRLAAVFGDVLPEATQDELDPDSTEGDAQERWLRRQVPPHHG